MLGDEAQIAAAWLHALSFGLELVAGEMEVDLLVAKLEGMARLWR